MPALIFRENVVDCRTCTTLERGEVSLGFIGTSKNLCDLLP
jgi:hypothetical protein